MEALVEDTILHISSYLDLADYANFACSNRGLRSHLTNDVNAEQFTRRGLRWLRIESQKLSPWFQKLSTDCSTVLHPQWSKVLQAAFDSDVTRGIAGVIPLSPYTQLSLLIQRDIDTGESNAEFVFLSVGNIVSGAQPRTHYTQTRARIHTHTGVFQSVDWAQDGGALFDLLQHAYVLPLHDRDRMWNWQHLLISKGSRTLVKDYSFWPTTLQGVSSCRLSLKVLSISEPGKEAAEMAKWLACEGFTGAAVSQADISVRNRLRLEPVYEPNSAAGDVDESDDDDE